MISATGDWTAETLEAEYPAVRAIYALAGAEDRVSAVRFTAEHNYNKDSREAMYAWMARWLQGVPAQPRLEEKAFTPERLPDLLVFHGRALPEGALTADSLTASWIDAAQQQLTETSLSVRAAALRHALAFAHDAAPKITPAPPVARRRPVVLTAGDNGGAEAGLRKGGYTVRPIRFTPFDAEAAAKVQHFDTYNRTAASQRVADVVAALRAEPGAILVAAGDDALAGALAAAIEPPRLAVLDVKGFDTTRDDDFLAHLYIPGLRRAGDFQTASDMAPGRLVIHGTGAHFDVDRARACGARPSLRRKSSRSSMRPPPAGRGEPLGRVAQKRIHAPRASCESIIDEFANQDSKAPVPGTVGATVPSPLGGADAGVLDRARGARPGRRGLLPPRRRLPRRTPPLMPRPSSPRRATALGGDQKLAGVRTFVASGPHAPGPRQQPGADRVRDLVRAARQVRAPRRGPCPGERADVDGVQR